MIRTKSLNTLFVFIFLGYILPQEYNIYGVVLDKENMHPLENVNVSILNTEMGTTTDKDGAFNLMYNGNPNDKIDFHIRMIGFAPNIKTVELKFSRIDLGEILLTSKPVDIGPVHVHSHAQESDQISNIILDGQKLNENLSGNIATSLSKYPGIGAGSFGIATSKPVLRGYSGNRFLITKNGSTIGDLSQTSIDHAIALDMSSVKMISIIRGPKSLIYGANAIGGIVDAKTKGSPQSKVNRFYKSLALGFESQSNGLDGNINLYIPFYSNQINLLVNKRITNNQTSADEELGSIEIDNTASNTSSYALTFTRYNNDNYINFKIENYNMDYGIPPSEEGHIDGVDIELLKNSMQINYHQDISLFNLSQLDIRYSLVDYRHKEYENNKSYYDVELNKITNSIKLDLMSPDIVIGTEFNFKRLIPREMVWTPITNLLKFSFYSFYERKINSFELLGSIRAEQQSILPNKNGLSLSNLEEVDIINKKFQTISSSIGIRREFGKFEVNSWLMGTMQAPSIEELYSDGPHLGSYSYEIGNPDLEPEKTLGIETSIRYNDDNIDLSLIGFYNYSPYYYQYIKMGECNADYVGDSHPCAGADYIEWGSGPGWLYKYQINGIESLIKGIEFNFSYRYKKVSLSYDLSYLNGENLTSDSPLSYMNPNKQIINLRYENKQMNANARFTWVHSQNRIGEFETSTPSAFLTDLVVGYRIGEHKLIIQLNNIFNQEYYNHLSKIKSVFPEPGRNIAINYRIAL